MLTEGTRRRDWRRIAEQAESKGMVVESNGSFESIGVSVDALAATGSWPWSGRSSCCSNPPSPRTAAPGSPGRPRPSSKSLADQPDVKTVWGFHQQLYSPHPRSRPLHGSAESLAGLTPDDCAGFHRRAAAHGILASVAGVMDEDAVRERLLSLLGTPETAADPYPGPPVPVGTGPRAFVATDAEDQAHLYVGHLTVPRRHPDYAALELLAVILGSGAGLTGRIPARIREREGLAYTAYAQTVAGSGLDRGRLVAYVGTSPATVEKAERGVIEEITRLVEDGIEDGRAGGVPRLSPRPRALPPRDRPPVGRPADRSRGVRHPPGRLRAPQSRAQRPRPPRGRGGGPPAYSPGRAAGDGRAAGGCRGGFLSQG